MHVDVTPRVDDAAELALRVALEETRAQARPVASAWRRAALREGIERGGYALSPRRTRGATRA